MEEVESFRNWLINLQLHFKNSISLSKKHEFKVFHVINDSKWINYVRSSVFVGNTQKLDFIALEHVLEEGTAIYLVFVTVAVNFTQIRQGNNLITTVRVIFTVQVPQVNTLIHI